MAPSSSSSSSSCSLTPSLPPRSHLFTPIQEGNESEDTEERRRFESPSSTSTTTTIHHYPTPLHKSGSKKARKPKPKPEPDSVSCNNCRPNPREKTSVMVVPVENHHHHNTLSPLFKSIISTISRKSPKPEPEPQKDQDNLRKMVSDLSHKLTQATKRRDEAILEASRLKSTMAELEKKLNRLEVYCHNLKSGLDICNQAQIIQGPKNSITTNNYDVIIKNFLVAVSDSRTSIRFLSKSLSSQLKLMGVKVFERLALVLKSQYDFKFSCSSTIDNLQFKALQYYLEAILSEAFYQDFESSGLSKWSMNRILNPVERSEFYYSSYSRLKDLTWENVLNKGTKHFSDEFSRFCDRKMSEIVGLLGWTRAWPEQLLQAFFGASKSVWLVHLLANSINPNLVIFRVEKGARFDPVYMEEMGGDQEKKKVIPTMVKIMVAPGFYVFDNVVKCKVITRYYNYNNNTNCNYNYDCDNNSNCSSVFSGNDE